ncbi:MAG: nitrile hydratase subunit beta [Pseudomonadota bacterium]
MDGIHDMGGMHGFGRVDLSQDEPFSKANWRARMFGMELSYTQPGGFNVDWLRHVMECMPPALYLSSEYYDRWYWRDVGVLVNAGWVTIDELKSGKATRRPAGQDEPLSPESVPMILHQGLDNRRPEPRAPAYKPGDPVRAKTHGSPGATRLPGYLRGHVGVVEAYRGCFVLPDANAHGEERADPLYSVRFSAQELWGDVKSPGDLMLADLWESYLEPTNAGR